MPDNTQPKGAKGAARLRESGDGLKRWLTSRRPSEDCPERWTNYRTEACVAVNEARDQNADAERIAALNAEHQAAVDALRRLRPSTLENLGYAACIVDGTCKLDDLCRHDAGDDVVVAKVEMGPPLQFNARGSFDDLETAPPRRRATRREMDHYVTPAWCVDAIAPHLPTGPAFDPSAGEGAILDALHAHSGLDRGAFGGLELHPDRARKAYVRGYSVVQRDALDGARWQFTTSFAPLVVMNPPFSLAQEFVVEALRQTALRRGTVAALLRLAFLEGRKRAAFHAANPSDVYVLSRRPSFTGKGTDATAYAWFVWGPGRGGRWATLGDLG
jgi:hypothetical protein